MTHITDSIDLNLNAAINPAWDKNFNIIKSVAIDSSKTVITEEDWNAIGAKFAAYQTWKNAKAGVAVEGLGLDAIKNFIAQDKKAALLDLVAQDAALKEESPTK